MSVIFIDLNARYIPKTSDQNIKMDVEIGNGQSGAYVIFLGQELKGTNKAANLGKKADVEDKVTTVAAAIIDKLEETNWTSITIKVKEAGIETILGPYEKQVPEHLDTAIYTVKVVHI